MLLNDVWVCFGKGTCGGERIMPFDVLVCFSEFMEFLIFIYPPAYFQMVVLKAPIGGI